VADIDKPIYIGIETLKKENLVDHVPEQFRTLEFLRQKRVEMPGIEPTFAPYENRCHELNWLDTGCDTSLPGLKDISSLPDITSNSLITGIPHESD